MNNTDFESDVNVDLDHDTDEQTAFYDNDNTQTIDLEQRSKTKLIAGSAGLLALLAALTSYQLGWLGNSQSVSQDAGSTPPATVVSTSLSQKTLMAPSTTLPGTVVSLRDAVIASETSGKVISVALIGESLEAGEPLAVIDSNNTTQLVEQRKAELARLKSLNQYHKDYFARVSDDDEQLGIPEIAIAELRSNMETARADVARAESALKAAQIDLERTTIRAPFAGRVVSQSIQPGEYAQIGNAIARLVDTKSLEVSAQVPAALVQPLTSGTKLEISGLGKSVSAPLRALVPVGNEVSRTMELRVGLPNADFLVGSPVRVTLPTAEEREVVAIHRDAVVLRSNSQYVFLVDEQRKAHKKIVELGYAQDDMIEVIGDIPANATVIVRGGERLRDGQTVTWETPASDPILVSKLSR